MPGLTNLLLAEWRRQGVKTNPPANDEQLRALERFLGMPLPGDVAAYFSSVDGMQDCESDERMIGFWETSRIVSGVYDEKRNDQDGTFRDVAFADFMIDSAFFVFRLRSNTMTIVCTATRVEFATFTAFLHEYLHHVDELCYS
jgi:hypothetical protein